MPKGNNETRLYLDNAAATTVDERVLEAMAPFWKEKVGNAGALHREGVEAKESLSRFREEVAGVLYAQPGEVIFTSGGTESNNLALLGAVYAREQSGVPLREQHVVVSSIEHSSVLDTARELERRGVAVTYIPVDGQGFVEPSVLGDSVTARTTIVSVLYAQNEIGVIQHMKDLSRVVRHARSETSAYPLLHTDASQAPLWLPCHTPVLGVNLLTLDGQKVCGPKGIGALFRAHGTPLSPIMFGGGQEYGLRPGTPPLPLIAGMARALVLAEDERDTYLPRVCALRDECIAALRSQVPSCELNGPEGDDRLANNVNMSFLGVDAEQLVIELDARGIAASTRSACLFGDEPGSYIIRALGKDEARATSAVRLSFSRRTTEEEAAHTVRSIVEVVGWLRASGTVNS